MFEGVTSFEPQSKKFEQAPNVTTFIQQEVETNIDMT